MKKSVLLIFLFLISVQNINAQEWAPIGAKWIYKASYFSWPPPSNQYEEWQVVSDSTIQGKEVRKIKRTSELVALNSISHFFTYEENDTAYFFNETLNQFEIWFDFSANVGDSWSNQLDTCTYHYTIDSLFSAEFSGEELDILLYTREANFTQMTGTIIKNIGDYGFIPFNPYECMNIPIDGSEYQSLNCYEDPNIGQINFRPNPNCYSPNYISSINENDISELIEVFPNPSMHEFNLKLPSLVSNIRVVDINGKIKKECNTLENTLTLKVDELSSGLYFLLIFEEENLIAKKKIIISK